MKTLRTVAFGAFLSFSFLYSAAQDHELPVQQPNFNKPQLFADLPQKITLKVTDLEVLFSLAVGTDVTTRFTPGYHFSGIVVSKSDASDPNVKSVVIRSPERENAIFTFTRVRGENGEFVYRGRIISKSGSDAFELVNENNEYVLQKKNYHEIIVE